MKRRDEEWLTVEQARRLLGMATARAVYVLIDTGKLPAYRFGTAIRLRTADVREYLERGGEPPGHG